MANLFSKTPEFKHISTSVGDFYAKPLPMSMIGWATKLSDPDVKPMDQAVAFATILRAIAVDVDGNPLDDIQAMSAEDISAAFPLDDLMAIIQVIMPQPEEGDLGNGH